MKYLKYFNSLSEYNSFRESDAFIKPNVSHIKNENVVEYSTLNPDDSLIVNEINLAQVTTYAPSTGSNDEVVMISFIPQYPPASDLTIATSVEIRDVLDNTAIVNENVTIPAGSEGVRQEFSDALAYPQFLNRIISAECTPLKDSTYKYVVTF